MIDKIEEIVASDDPEDPRGLYYYSKLLDQGWHIRPTATGEWVWEYSGE